MIVIFFSFREIWHFREQYGISNAKNIMIVQMKHIWLFFYLFKFLVGKILINWNGSKLRNFI